MALPPDASRLGEHRIGPTMALLLDANRLGLPRMTATNPEVPFMGEYLEISERTY